MTTSYWFARKTTRFSRKNAIKGFTLIEVLVVVAIIALLISILIPSLKRTRQQARAVVCSANLRTSQHALIFYVQANKDHMPYDAVSGVNIWEHLHKYVQKDKPSKFKDLERCPTFYDDYRLQPDAYYPIYVEWYLCADDQYYHWTNQRSIDGKDAAVILSFCVNSRVINDPDKSRSSRKMSSIKNLSQLVFVAEVGDDQFDGGRTWKLKDFNDVTPQTSWEIRHGTGSNVLYLDGHVQFHKYALSGPQYGLPLFPMAFVPGWRPGDYGGRYDNYVRAKPNNIKPPPY